MKETLTITYMSVNVISVGHKWHGVMDSPLSSEFVIAHVQLHTLSVSPSTLCVGVGEDHPRVKGRVAQGPVACMSVFHEAMGLPHWFL